MESPRSELSPVFTLSKTIRPEYKPVPKHTQPVEKYVLPKTSFPRMASKLPSLKISPVQILNIAEKGIHAGVAITAFATTFSVGVPLLLAGVASVIGALTLPGILMVLSGGVLVYVGVKCVRTLF